MLKTHLKTVLALAMIFVMVFALTAPALAEENSELKAAEEAVREAEENYNIAVERYNNAKNIDADALTAERDELAAQKNRAAAKVNELTTKIAGARDTNTEEYRADVEQLKQEQDSVAAINRRIMEIDNKLNSADTLKEEMYRCELGLDIAKYNLEKLQQALIIPQTGDNGAVYLAAGVMLILAGAGLAVSRKRS